MGWYFVTKKIKGKPYLYQQRTWREGRRVRTESHYVCPGGVGRLQGCSQSGSLTVQSLDSEEPQATPVRKARMVYHGSREGIKGKLKSGDVGNFGSGFYVSDESTAELYAEYSPKSVAWLTQGGDKTLLEQEHEGYVYKYDIADLKIITLTPDGYTDLLVKYLRKPKGKRWITDEDQERFSELLAAEGYHGIEIMPEGGVPYQTVVFESALEKLREVTYFEGDDETDLVLKSNPDEEQKPAIGSLKVKNLDRQRKVKLEDSVLYFHGSRKGFTGPPKASEDGLFGAGFYISVKQNAEIYAEVSSEEKPLAARVLINQIAAGEKEWKPVKDSERVYMYNIKNLQLARMKAAEYMEMIDEDLEEAKRDDPDMTEEDEALLRECSREVITETLAEKGFDGIEIIEDDITPYQIVVFPDSLEKLQAVEETDDMVLDLRKDGKA